jgi:hypothetical protein
VKEAEEAEEAEEAMEAKERRHQAKFVQWTQLADGAFAAKARCCDDRATDSWCTVSVDPGSSAEDVLKLFDNHRKRVEELHAKAEEVAQAVAALIAEDHTA